MDWASGAAHGVNEGAWLSSTWGTPALMIDSRFHDCWKLKSHYPDWTDSWPESAIRLLTLPSADRPSPGTAGTR